MIGAITDAIQMNRSLSGRVADKLGVRIEYVSRGDLKMNMKRNVKWGLGAWAALFMVTVGVTPVLAGEARNVNFAAFEKLSPDFQFEPGIVGKFSDFIAAMEGSQILMLSHTADAEDGDVINIQQDVLRQTENGLGDFGINCSLSFSDESTQSSTAYLLGGLCTILRTGRGDTTKIRAVIPRTNVPDTSLGADVWVMIYEDKETGVAFYANVGTRH